MRNFALRLISYEAKEHKSAGSKSPAVFQSCERLHLYLAIFMGVAGSRSLFSRALGLGTAEVPWLRAVRMKEDGSLEGLDDLQAKLDRNALHEGGVVLLAQLLGLLVAFIGGNQTVRLVREVWPKVLLNDLDLEN